MLRASFILAALVLPSIARGEPTFQHNVDMKGFDYANFDLPRPSARLCQEACLKRRSLPGMDVRAAHPVRTACGVLAQIQGAGRPIQHLLRFRDAIMRIVILGGRDPSDEDTWSGTPRSLIGSLRRAGHDVTAIGPLPPIETPWRRM
jgi:hypothetical protein